MSQTAVVMDTDTLTPISGTVTSSGPGVDMTTVASATLVISGIGSKPATIVPATSSSVALRWVYDGTLLPGSYKCWWRIVYADGGVQSAPTGGFLTIEVNPSS